MTVEDYRKSLEKLPHKTPDGRSLAEVMTDTVDIWSNDAARGYAIIAAELAGVDPATVGEIVKKMRRVFDDMTVDEAAEVYVKSPY